MLYTVLTFLVMCIIIKYVFKIYNQDGSNKFRYYFNYFLYYMVTMLVAGSLIPYFLLSMKNVRNAKIAAYAIKQVTKVLAVDWQLRNGEILAEDRGAVVISNHQNSLDILGMFNIWHVADKMAAISKKELFYVWPFGLSAYLAGTVFIDRNDPKGAYKQMEMCTEVMIKNKTKIVIYPEGSRNKDYTKFQPFKKGAFNIAVAAQVPIIPIVYSPYYFINKEKHIFNKGHIIMQCLEPVPTKGLTKEDVPKLIEQIHQKMFATYKELSKEIFSSLPEDYPYTLKG